MVLKEGSMAKRVGSTRRDRLQSLVLGSGLYRMWES